MTAKTQTTTAVRNGAEKPTTLSPEEARQGEMGNGIWVILSVSTALAIGALIVLFGANAG